MLKCMHWKEKGTLENKIRGGGRLLYFKITFEKRKLKATLENKITRKEDFKITFEKRQINVNRIKTLDNVQKTYVLMS